MMEEEGVRKVLYITLALNVIVSVTKLIYGYATGSVGILSDGFHSFFDGVSNVVGLIGIWVASNPPDEEHPYGHKKYETLFTIIISVMIFLTSWQILLRVIESFKGGKAATIGLESFAVMGFTFAVNVFVMLYEAKRGRELKSDFLMADSMHTKSDLLVSTAVIAGLILTRLGFKSADPLAGIVIAVFIAKIGYNILKRASDVLVDSTRLSAVDVKRSVMCVEGVKGCHKIRTRGLETAIHIDMHVLVDSDLPMVKAHDVANRIEEKLRCDFPEVVDVVIHIEPDIDGDD